MKTLEEVMAPEPPGSPLMKAWETYKVSKNYANTRMWALREEHVDGSLWAAFCQGYIHVPKLVKFVEAQECKCGELNNYTETLINPAKKCPRCALLEEILA